MRPSSPRPWRNATVGFCSKFFSSPTLNPPGKKRKAAWECFATGPSSKNSPSSRKKLKRRRHPPNCPPCFDAAWNCRKRWRGGRPGFPHPPRCTVFPRDLAPGAFKISFMTDQLPSIVIVGRPNVGKSTLFNRVTGTRRSIVTNEPGITRDRIYGTAEWDGRSFEVVDTGGIVPDDKALIPQEILRQANIAIKKASLLVLVVDSQAGLTPLDEELGRLLRGTGKPFVLAVNKVDSPSQEANAAPFHSLGVSVF